MNAPAPRVIRPQRSHETRFIEQESVVLHVQDATSTLERGKAEEKRHGAWDDMRAQPAHHATQSDRNLPVLASERGATIAKAEEDQGRRRGDRRTKIISQRCKVVLQAIGTRDSCRRTRVHNSVPNRTLRSVEDRRTGGPLVWWSLTRCTLQIQYESAAV